MATISTTVDTDFTVPSAADWDFIVLTGKARLFEKIGSSYVAIAEVPQQGTHHVIVSATVASSVYKWVSLESSTTVLARQ